MSPKFISALAFTLAQEGGYADIEGDSGGETYRGISRNNWPQWSGWQTIDQIKGPGFLETLKAIEDKLYPAVVDFYLWNFWAPNYDKINSQSIVTFIFDMGVNESVKHSVGLVQKALVNLGQEIEVDGVFGGQTLAAVNSCYPADLLVYCKQEATTFYKLLALKNPQDRKFLPGWLNRVNAHIMEES